MQHTVRGGRTPLFLVLIMPANGTKPWRRITGAGGPVYLVMGGLNLLDNDVMQMVAREGIEPPTPAFSGLLDHRLTDSVAENTRLTGHKFGLHLDASAILVHLDSTQTPLKNCFLQRYKPTLARG
jgi:hypothetical protein